MCAGVYLCIHVCVSGISGRLGWDLVEMSWCVQHSAGCGLRCLRILYGVTRGRHSCVRERVHSSITDTRGHICLNRHMLQPERADKDTNAIVLYHLFGF